MTEENEPVYEMSQMGEFVATVAAKLLSEEDWPVEKVSEFLGFSPEELFMIIGLAAMGGPFTPDAAAASMHENLRALDNLD